MPQPVELDQLQDPLLNAYQRAWARVKAEQARLLADPIAYRRKMRLVEMRRSIERQMSELDASLEEWVSTRLPYAYSLGVASAGAGATEGLAGSQVWAQIHAQAVQSLAQSLFTDLLGATQHVNDTAKQLVRDIAKDEALQKAIEGKSVRESVRLMKKRLEASGIHAVRYADGSKHGLDEYAQVAMRTKTASAYNWGALNGHHDVAFFEVFDGPLCGWTYHDDTLASGRIVSRDEAMAYPISHPNCRRAFGPRPDLDADGAKAANQALPARWSDEQRAIQAERAAAGFDPKPPSARLERNIEQQAAADRAAERLARQQARKLATGDLAPPMQAIPGLDDLVPPLVKGELVAKVPSVQELIDKGWDADKAVAEHKRLLVNARNAEARARRKAQGVRSTADLNVPGSEHLTFAEKSKFGSEAGALRTKLLAEGKDKAVAEYEWEKRYRQLVAGRLDEMGYAGKQTYEHWLATGAKVPELKSPKQLLIEADQAQKPTLGQLHLEPKALHDGVEGPGGLGSSFGKPVQWYDRMHQDHTDYVPVVDLTVTPGYKVGTGIATRRDGISYLLETADGAPVTAEMRQAFEAHIAKIQGVLKDVPEEARKHQRGYAILMGKNPADAHWAKEYGIPDFVSAATGGNGRTYFWGAGHVQPGTIVHELGHNLDSMHEAAAPGHWLSEGALSKAYVHPSGQVVEETWEQLAFLDKELTKRLRDSIKSGTQTEFVETRRGVWPIVLGKDGPTEYGSVSVHEDFAESFRLYCKDRREGKVGYFKPEPGQSVGVNARFRDLFPERAAYFDKLLGIDTSLAGPTEWELAARKRIDATWGFKKILEDAPNKTLAQYTKQVQSALGDPVMFGRAYGISRTRAELEVKRLLQEAGDHWAQLQAEKAAFEAAKKAAAKAAADAAKAAKATKQAVLITKLPSKDAVGIGVKAANAEKKALAQGKSAVEAAAIRAQVKAELTAARLAELNAKGAQIIDQVVASDLMAPGIKTASRSKASAFLKGAGLDVHPDAVRQYAQAAQAKANIAAELGKRLNESGAWDDFVEHWIGIRDISETGKWKGGSSNGPWEVALEKLTGRGPKSLSADEIRAAAAKLTPQQRREILVKEASDRVQGWAASSGDTHYHTVAMQMAIRDELGATGDPFGGFSKNAYGGVTREGVEQFYTKVAPFYRRFVRAQYEHTQAELAKAGITEISVYRGMNLTREIPWVQHLAAGEVGTTRPGLMPANSWSTRESVSKRFGTSMLRAKIPASRILGSARTGFGCLNEWEYVVLDTDGLVELQLAGTAY